MSKEEVEEIDDLIKKLAINKSLSVSVERSLIGSYNWIKEKKICIPGVPAVLREDFISVKVPYLNDQKAHPSEVHPNEYLHTVYFEPIEEVLKWANKNPKSFDLWTDRNNLRKIDAALENNKQNYTSFSMLLRKTDSNILIIKRQEEELRGSSIGKEFEKILCKPTSSLSCHIIVDIKITINEKPFSLLLRGEVDCVAPKSTTVPPYKVDHTSANGLQVSLSSDGAFKLDLKNVRELKMKRELNDVDHFQSWLLGIPSIIHGVKYRTQTKVTENAEFHQRLGKAVQLLMEYRDKMEECVTYKLKRVNGGPLKLEKASETSEKWFAENNL